MRPPRAWARRVRSCTCIASTRCAVPVMPHSGQAMIIWRDALGNVASTVRTHGVRVPWRARARALGGVSGTSAAQADPRTTMGPDMSDAGARSGKFAQRSGSPVRSSKEKPQFPRPASFFALPCTLPGQNKDGEAAGGKRRTKDHLAKTSWRRFSFHCGQVGNARRSIDLAR